MRVYIHALEYVDVAPFKRSLIAFGIYDSQQIAILLDDYRSSILLKTDLDVSEVREMIDKRTNVTITNEERMPLVGFSNNSKDTLIRITLHNEQSRYRVVQSIKGSGEIIHEMVRPEAAFLHETHLHLMTVWEIQCTSEVRHLSKVLSCKVYRSPFATIRETTDLMTDGGFHVCFFRIHAKSVSSTMINQFTPTPSADPIQLICLQIGISSSPMVLQDRDEKTILLRFFELVQKAHLFVFCGDRFNDLEYVIIRAEKNGISSDCLSFVKDRPCKLIYKEKKLLDIVMHGKHRLNIASVLPKLMISPPMSGYTLLDIVSHPKLLKHKHTELADMVIPLQPDVTVLTKHLLLSIAVIKDMYNDNNLFLQFASISTACDLSLSLCVDRGQQARIRNIFFRAFYENGIYFNQTQLEVPFLTVQKSRSESSFPDPQWIRNPPLSSLTVESTETPSTDKKPKLHTAWHAIQQQRREKEMALKENKRKTSTKGFQGGFVIEPEAGFYFKPEHAVSTLDFASLYPSIIEGYVICYRRVLYNAAYLQDPDAELEYIPMTDTVCAVFVKSYKGVPVETITDKIIHNVVQLRKRVRAGMKSLAPDSFEYAVLDARQLGCKVIQNACYGFLGSRTSGMLCTALAAAVTNIGANMNKRVRHLVLSEGGRAVYGDTDSVMVQFPTHGKKTRDEILEHIYSCAHNIQMRSKSMFPAPNMVEFECVKLPFLMLSKKKTYAAVQYPPNTWKNVEPEQVTKGMSFKKRDRCALVQTTVRTIRDMVMAMADENEIVSFFMQSLQLFSKLPLTMEDMRPFVVTCRLAEEYKNENVLAPHLAKQMEAASGQKPMQGSRLAYVIVDGTESHYMRARVPSTVLGTRLDVAWYIETQLMKSVAQLLSVDVHQPLLKRLQYDACLSIRCHHHASLTKIKK